MAVSSAQVAVGAVTAVALNAAGSSQRLVVLNKGSVSVFLGASAVTSSTGLELAAGASTPVGLFAAEVLYAIAASGSQTVHVLRTNV